MILIADTAIVSGQFENNVACLDKQLRSIRQPQASRVKKTGMIKYLLLVVIATTIVDGLVSDSRPSCVNGMCKLKVDIPHASLNGTKRMVLNMWYKKWNRYALLREQKPLALILPGAVVQPDDYSEIAKFLAFRGYAVAVPEYSTRPIRAFYPPGITEAIDAAIAAGYDCPRNGNFISAQVIVSVSNFLAERAKSVFQGDTLLVGHSYGAIIAANAAFNICPKLIPALEEIICEGFEGIPKRMGVRVLAMFEGALDAPVTIPKDMLFVHAYSPLFSRISRNNVTSLAQEVRDKVVGGRERFVDVAFSYGTNHFLINNFQPETNHSRTLCTMDRGPPEDQFRTTAAVQGQVIMSCGNLLDILYFSFSRGISMVRRVIIVIQRLPLIAYARLL